MDPANSQFHDGKRRSPKSSAQRGPSISDPAWLVTLTSLLIVIGLAPSRRSAKQGDWLRRTRIAPEPAPVTLIYGRHRLVTVNFPDPFRGIPVGASLFYRALQFGFLEFNPQSNEPFEVEETGQFQFLQPIHLRLQG